MFSLKSKSSIGKNSSNNTVIQNSQVTNIMTNSPVETIELMAKYQAFDDIQQCVRSVLDAARNSHPLFPAFSATYSSELNKLVSTPETADAFERHPKKIKSTIKIDYKKYPHMDRTETPWEYAYRTQTNVELATTSYKEYLGETVDPFPVVEYSEGMMTVIGFNEFPPAVDAVIKSGEVSICVKLRRKPSLKFGELLFGNESTGHGFNINISTDETQKKTTINFVKLEDCDLATHLACEELLDAIHTTRNISIRIRDVELMRATFNEDELKGNLFSNAKILKVYINNLLTIERHTGCKFNPNIGEVSFDDVEASIIMAASLEGKWRLSKLNFDDSIRCDYDHIPNDIADYNTHNSDTVAEMKVLSINLHGEEFCAEKLIIVYRDARINNIASVLKNKKKKKKKILITMKPTEGNEVFSKYQLMEALTYVGSVDSKQ